MESKNSSELLVNDLINPVFRVIDVLPQIHRRDFDMEKKEVIKALEEKFGVKARYQGTPSFAYEIEGDGTIYTVTRQGAVLHEGVEVSIERILHSHEEAQKELEPEPKAIEEQVDMKTLELNLEGHTPNSIRNFINMISSKQRLIALAMETPWHPIGTGTEEDWNPLQRGVAEELSAQKFDTMEEMAATLTELQQRMPGMEFELSNDRPSVRINLGDLDEVKAEAVRTLFEATLRFAKTLRHASFKETQEDNPKFAMRTWMIRLGLHGPEHKETRKVILSALEGNAAFRTDPKEKLTKE